MKVFYTAQHSVHDPRHFLVNGALKASPEVPARAEALLAAAEAAGHEISTVETAHGLGPLAAVHTPEYLQFLARIHERWQRIEGASEEVIPNIHPNWRDGRYPASAVGQAGYHMADTACPISAGTWSAAQAAAGLALTAVEGVLEGGAGAAAYALCRPPGHHAFADMAGGFCYLNNAAIAAQSLRRRFERVAILDVDVHHGNGTQGIFYQRADVLTVSLHADPVRFYPFFWGHADERGSGPGLGCNLNIPLPRGSGDTPYLEALDAAIVRIQSFAPEALVVALGLDAHEDDPLAGLKVTSDGFARIGEAVARFAVPIVLLQEGGYLTPALGGNLVAFLGGFETARGS
jgi:acetoin utilization deacetylase AcuC-like enzyme